MSQQATPLSATVASQFRPPRDASRWRYVNGIGDGRSYQDNLHLPSAATPRACAKQAS